MRNLLQIGRNNLASSAVDGADITLAHRILPWEYAKLVRLRRGTGELLFLERTEGSDYSDFHMSSGERSVLRLSLELAHLRNALGLIDEVEAELHPFTQQEFKHHVATAIGIDAHQGWSRRNSPVNSIKRIGAGEDQSVSSLYRCFRLRAS